MSDEPPRRPLTIILEPDCCYPIISCAPTVYERHYDTDVCLQHIYSKHDSQITFIPIFPLFDIGQFQKIVKNNHDLIQINAFHILCNNTQAVDEWADDNYPKVKSINKIETNKDLQIQELIAQNCDRQLEYHDTMRRIHSANSITPLVAIHSREERQCIQVKLDDLSQRLIFAQKCKLDHQMAVENYTRTMRNLERQLKDLTRRQETLQQKEEHILEGCSPIQSTD
ncbi:hypothetical protein I4U23_023133 [Adineta vaga]|nr:hypothetical protein I4U23_023133 [Adineta vaga]